MSPKRAEAIAANVAEARVVLEELRILSAESRELQSEAMVTLMQLTDAHARKIAELEEKARPGYDLGRVASVTPLVGLIGALSVVLPGWRKDLREADAARRGANRGS